MSGGLRDRLERLRAHAASVKQAEAEARAESERSEAGRSEATTKSEESATDAEAQAREGYKVAGTAAEPDGAEQSRQTALEDLKVTEESNEFGSFLLRRIIYPLEYRHGHYSLDQLFEGTGSLHPVAVRQNRKRHAESPIRSESISEDLDEGDGAARDEAGDAIRPESLLFLDTETTGLGVGSGNVAFMIGIGYVDSSSRTFVIEQLLIRHPGEERAMLAYLLKRFDGCTHLVTYNGRTFDWPVLVNRFVLNGWRPSGAEPGHLDFLHPARALWRNTLASCRLGLIEEERLGIRRIEDVPGSLAPELYMRYLREGKSEHLRGVYLHNERDVLTLAALTIHFGGVLSGRLGAEWALPTEGEELYRTAAWLELHGQNKEAELLFAELMRRLEEPTAIRWLLPAAARYKRLGRMDEATVLWERSAAIAEASLISDYDAHVELAMLYEHRLKDVPLALHYAERAVELSLRRPAAGRDRDRAKAERAALLHRLDRLKRKTGRSSAR